jgi:dihydroneopterin aldolase
MIFYTFLGIEEWERENKRRIEIDVELLTKEFVDLREVYKQTKNKVEGKSYSLIEEVAKNVADAVLQNSKIEKVLVRVRKPCPPVDGIVDYIGCEYEETKG